MKKALIFLILFLFTSRITQSSPHTLKADTTTTLPSVNDLIKKQDDLVLLGKVWGLLKYHHPNVVSGKVDWDGKLIDFLPNYILSKNIEARNRLLIQFINNLGPIPLFKTGTENRDKVIKIYPDFNWIKKFQASPELVDILTNLKNNHSPDSQYYIKFSSDGDINQPTFLHEKSYSELNNLNYAYKLLAVYRYWNIIEYWYPYKYLLQGKWDGLLNNFIKESILTKNEAEFTMFVRKMAGAIKDSHAIVSGRKVEDSKGRYQMPFTVKFLNNQAVVTSIDTNEIKNHLLKTGDIISSINNISFSQYLLNVSPYISASNTAVINREAAYLFTRSQDSLTIVNFLDANNKRRVLTFKNSKNIADKVYDFAYQSDSTYFLIRPNILYVNIGRVTRAQIELLKPILKKVSAIILDNRQYPKNPAGDLISALLIPDSAALNLFTSVIAGYPGTFKYSKPIVIGSKNPEYFKGKVITLIDQGTQSTGEFFTMAFKLAPKSIIIGSTTAGADGNVSAPFPLPGGYYTQITLLGVYYPDGKETQQIGIKPDIFISQSINGLKNHRDDLLEKAISIANQ